MYSWWWVRLSPETCRVKPLRRIKTQLLHLVGLISLTWYKIIHDIVPKKERLHKIRIAPTQNCRFAIGRTPYSTALRKVAMVDINGNGQRKDSRSYYELIHDGYPKNGYSGHTSHSGHSSVNVLYCGCWRNLWCLDRSLSGTWLSRIISTSYGDPSISSIGNGSG